MRVYEGGFYPLFGDKLVGQWNLLKVVIPGTEHHVNMEKPEEFNRVVLDFLGSLR